jgi:predicted transcriptional regulator
MDAPPVNRLLQLLRQRPSDTPDPAHVSHNRASPRESNPHSIAQSDIQSATRSDTREAQESDTQPARQSNRQPVPKGSTQPARSSTQPATESDTQKAHQGNTLSATQEDVSLAVTGLSKGQQRVLQFLLSNRDGLNHSRTIPIGYDAISRHCFLSRSGSRKVIGELCQRGLITRLETKRGETQGSVYLLESIILYATQSSTHEPQKSSTLSATQNNRSCSSNKELLLQDLILEGAFQELHPRSLISYLDKFDTVEDLQNFLDIANACIQVAKEGHGKPIQNPHGFLFAQLRAGYINPPDGYKSRKIRAQELRNQQLEEELATLRRLKEREQELQFELFVAQLTVEDLARLEREAQAEVKPHIGLSPAFQMDMHKDNILKQWFTRRTQLHQEYSGHA